MKFNDLTETQKHVIAEHFGFCPDFNFLDIFADIFGGLSEEDIDLTLAGVTPDPIMDAIDESLVYFDNQWIVARHYYSRPANYNEDECFTCLYSDVFEVCKKLRIAEERE